MPISRFLLTVLVAALIFLSASLVTCTGETGSPDGTKIAFVVGKIPFGNEKPSSEIYLINADGTGLTKLLSDPGENRQVERRIAKTIRLGKLWRRLPGAM